MNRKLLIQILKQIVVDFAYSPEKQINSFVLLNKPIDLLNTAFGATYSDYLSGHFWSRKWVNMGANTSDVQGQFPLLSVEQRTTVLNSILSNSRTFDVYLMVADKLTCENCANRYDRTPEQVNTNTSEMLHAYLSELATYGKYRVVIDGDESDVWMSEGRANYLYDNDLVDSEPLLMTEMSDMLLVNDSYRISELKLQDGYFGYGLKLLIDGCEGNDIVFNYASVPLSTIAQTVCESC